MTRINKDARENKRTVKHALFAGRSVAPFRCPRAIAAPQHCTSQADRYAKRNDWVGRYTLAPALSIHAGLDPLLVVPAHGMTSWGRV